MILSKIIHKETTLSTNDDIKAYFDLDEPEGLVIVAKHQMAGRGRNGAWSDDARGMILMSILLRPHCPVKSYIELTHMASMAIIDAIQEDLDNECSNLEIKWPNDVLFNGRKMAGILQEGSLEGETLKAVALGIGINVNTSADFFEQVDLPDATSLLIETGKTWDVEVLRDSILRHLDGLYSVFKDSL